MRKLRHSSLPRVWLLTIRARLRTQDFLRINHLFSASLTVFETSWCYSLGLVTSDIGSGSVWVGDGICNYWIMCYLCDVNWGIISTQVSEAHCRLGSVSQLPTSKDPMRLPLTYSQLGPTQKLLEQALQGQGWGNLCSANTQVRLMVRKMGEIPGERKARK